MVLLTVTVIKLIDSINSLTRLSLLFHKPIEVNCSPLGWLKPIALFSQENKVLSHLLQGLFIFGDRSRNLLFWFLNI